MGLGLVLMAALALPTPTAELPARALAAPHAETVATATHRAARHAAFLSGCLSTTGRSATLLLPPGAAVELPQRALAAGDVVVVRAPDGTCGGVGQWNPEGVAIAVWADDPYTPEVDGLVPGAAMQLSVLSAADGTVFDASAVKVAFAEGYSDDTGFQVDGLYMVAAATMADAPGADDALVLAPASPNPTHGRTSLAFALPAETDLTLDVFDALGRRVARVAEGLFPAGAHTVAFDATGLASGLYVCRLVAGGMAVQQRLTVAR